MNGTNESLSAVPKAASIGVDASVNARLFAPNGTLWFVAAADATGTFIARDVRIGASAHIAKDAPPACNADDGNPCTADSCDPATGQAVHDPLPVGTSCGNGNACDGDEACDGLGACAPGSPPQVDDGNPCTTDVCSPTSGITHVPVAPDTSCADANACNGAELCNASGQCQPGTPLVTDDGNVCTLDACDPTSGVSHTPQVGAACDDGNACTGSDSCDATGACIAGSPVNTDDGNECTLDACDPIAGVTHTPQPGAACNDGDACTTGDSCSSGGVCTAGTTLPSDDGNECTLDACDPVAGVTHTPQPGTSCSDGNACTTNDACDSSGACTAGPPVATDDGNPCTLDSCDPSGGVVHTLAAAGTNCADGNACNGVELCDASGGCASGEPVAVDDGNACTMDACDAVTGAVSHSPEPAGTSCASGSCTTGATCDGTGICSGGTPANVDDSNPCTIDSCDPVTGAVHYACSPINRTVSTTILDSTSWLFEGTAAPQVGVAPGTIAPHRAAVVRGRVLDRAGAPLPDVVVTIQNHPELGVTTTHADGMFDMVVNGGGELLFDLRLPGYLPVQRPVIVPWQDFAWMDEAVMVALDPQVTTIDLSAPTALQVARGTVQSDANGTRQATLLFPSATAATMILDDGSTLPLSTLSVRATEYSVGSTGPAAMPAPLPPTSGYTYATELSADEGIVANAKRVEFTQPLAFYVENFLGFPPGTIVPFGYYDRVSGRWVAEPNGVVLGILSTAGGIATVDTNGDGLADDASILAPLGIDSEELTKLAQLYGTGATLWRTRLTHFSAYDCNWNIGPPPDSSPPPPPGGNGGSGNGGNGGNGNGGNGGNGNTGGSGGNGNTSGDGGNGNTGASGGGGGNGGGGNGGGGNGGGGNGGGGANDPGTTPDQDENCDESGNSTLECTSRVFHEDVPIGGTGMRLVYSSDRQSDRVNSFAEYIPLSENTVPGSLKRIDLEISIAGQLHKQSFPPLPDQSMTFIWDGLDAYGRQVQSKKLATTTVKYVYDALINQTPNFGAYGTGVQLLGNSSRTELELTRSWKRSLGTWDAKPVGLGGWSINVHHIYDPIGRQLYMGDGSRRSGTSLVPVVTTLANQTDGILATDGLASAPDGSVYVADHVQHRVHRVFLDGTVTTAAGTGAAGYTGDGGLATSATLNSPYDVAVGRDGSIYIAELGNHVVRRVAPDGTIQTIAGTGVDGFSGDGGPATAAQLREPRGVVEGPDGGIYVSDTLTHRVRRIRPDGTIETFAGNGQSVQSPMDNVPAKQSSLPSPWGLAFNKDGELLIVTTTQQSPGNSARVRKVARNGTITTVAGCVATSPCLQADLSPDGVTATQAQLLQPRDVAVDENGAIYVALSGRALRRVDPDGTVRLVAGVGNFSNFKEGSPALGAAMSPVYIAMGQSRYYVSDFFTGIGVRVITPPVPSLAASYSFASEDGSELFSFDSTGRHLDTRNTRTGAIRFSFGYDAGGRLSSITDGDNNATTVEHDTNGNPTRVTGPYGHETMVAVDANGYLSAISNPQGETVTATYSTGGLMLSYVNARNFSAGVSHDSLGRIQSDQDPAGGALNFSQSNENTAWSVQQTSALGVAKSYRIDFFPGGAERRTNTFPDGTQSVQDRTANRTAVVTSPDGTVTTTTEAPDPRFGMLSPVISKTTATPAGLVRTETATRSFTGFNPLNPLVFLTETNTTNVNGRITTSVFDKSLQRTTTTSPAGRITRVFHDAQMRVTRREVTGISPVDFVYDSRGRLSTITQGTRVRSTSYFNTGDTRNGYIQSVTNALSQTTGFEPDAVGRILQQLDPDSTQTSFAWDENSNLTGVTPPGKPEHQQSFSAVDLLSAYTPPVVPGAPMPATIYTYDLDKRLTSTLRPDGLMTTRLYDSGSRLDQLITPSGIVDYDYFGLTPCPGCAPGRLQRITDPSGVVLEHAYDGILMIGMTWSGAVNGSVSFAYDPSFRLTSETVTAGGSVSPMVFGYDPDDIVICASPSTCAPAGVDALKITLNPGNGLVTGSTLGTVTDSYTYNSFGEMSSYTAKVGAATLFSEVVDTVSAPRDQLGRIVTRVETNGGVAVTDQYSYDLRGRLTDVFRGGALLEHYGYDGNGNRVLLQSPSGSVTGVYDAQDRLLSYGSLAFTYTANGEQATKTDTATGETTAYEYDVRGNLVRVDLPSGDVIEYLVDGRDRRVGKKKNGVLEKQWLYRNQRNVVAELDGNGALVARFTYGPRANVPESMVRDGITYRIVSDHLGSPRAVVDTTSGSSVWRADFDAWGTRSVLSGAADFVPFGFAAGLFDPETGLVRFGARDYEPTLGRWTAQDPIRFAGRQRNLYGYGFGNPVGTLDPTGLKPLPDEDCFEKCVKILLPDVVNCIKAKCGDIPPGPDLDKCANDKCGDVVEAVAKYCSEKCDMVCAQ